MKARRPRREPENPEPSWWVGLTRQQLSEEALKRHPGATKATPQVTPTGFGGTTQWDS